MLQQRHPSSRSCCHTWWCGGATHSISCCVQPAPATPDDFIEFTTSASRVGKVTYTIPESTRLPARYAILVSRYSWSASCQVLTVVFMSGTLSRLPVGYSRSASCLFLWFGFLSGTLGRLSVWSSGSASCQVLSVDFWSGIFGGCLSVRYSPGRLPVRYFRSAVGITSQLAFVVFLSRTLGRIPVQVLSGNASYSMYQIPFNPWTVSSNVCPTKYLDCPYAHHTQSQYLNWL